jgi:hypothetical protein
VHSLDSWYFVRPIQECHVRRSLCNSIRVLFPAISVVFTSAATCSAWHILDCHTRAMWSRTWHGPNALATPLNEYYIPRTPADCIRPGGYNCGAVCENVEGGIACSYGGRPYPSSAAAGFDPVQSERLGRIPNELDIVGAVGAVGPGPVPVVTPRR